VERSAKHSGKFDSRVIAGPPGWRAEKGWTGYGTNRCIDDDDEDDDTFEKVEEIPVEVGLDHSPPVIHHPCIPFP
jgi:hypothetical protein